VERSFLLKHQLPARFCVLLVACLIGSTTPATQWSSYQPPASVFARTIYLVRHGAYDSSAEINSRDGPGLVPLGVAQARLVANRLRGLPIRLTSLVASTMTRAQETARVMHETLTDLPVRSTPLLRECTPATTNPLVMRDTLPAEADACRKQLDKAFATFITPATQPDQYDVLVCHGNVIRYFVTKALGVDTKAWAVMSVAHASLTVIRVTPERRFVVLSVGDVGHIPPSLQSGTTATVPELVVPKPITGVMVPFRSGGRMVKAMLVHDFGTGADDKGLKAGEFSVRAFTMYRLGFCRRAKADIAGAIV
jgi:serine/threonine-protein phosphatase PGAM5